LIIFHTLTACRYRDRTLSLKGLCCQNISLTPSILSRCSSKYS
jgi:hypothetical protein